MSKNQIIKKNDKIKIHLAEQQDFSSHLIVYHDDHVCLYADCDYVSSKNSTMKKYLKKHNNMWDNHTKSQINYLILLFTVFELLYIYYFIMTLSDLSVKISVSATTAAAVLKKDKSSD